MAINPLEFLKLKGRLELFHSQHPRFEAFLKDVHDNAIMPGTVLEMKATTPDGREYITNIRLTEDDVETINIAKNAR